MNKIRYLISFLLIFCSTTLFAQLVPAWGGGSDLQDLSFGFTFQYLNSYFKIDKKPDWRRPFIDPETGKPVTDSLNSISSKNTPGFAIGFIARYRITDHLEMRSTPTLVFTDRKLSYSYKTASQNIDKQVQNTLVEFPLSLKLKSDRVGNFRAYVLGGVKYSQAISNKKADITTDPLAKMVRNVSGYGSYETGLGCDIYFEFFKLSPEIKISNTFGNVLVPENHPFSAPINKLSIHTIMLSLYFE